MVKIIKEAPETEPWKKQVTCPHCKRLVEVSAEDVKLGDFGNPRDTVSEMRFYFRCVCKSDVRLTHSEFDNSVPEAVQQMAIKKYHRNRK
jgi:hypothetical protein